MEEQLRNDLVRTSHRVHAAGWVSNHDGNLTVHLGGGRYLATPTAVSKADVRPEWLIVVDRERKVLQGTRKAFGELQLHLAAYDARPEVGCVIHAHPPAATAFAVSGAALGHPFMAEPVVSLGPEIPVVPCLPPGAPELSSAIGSALARADVVLLGGHGALSVGADLEQAFLRMELLEHLARIALKAQALGGTRSLDAALVAKLAAAGRPSSQATWLAATGASTAVPSGAAAPRSAIPSGPRADVGAVVAEALRRLG